MFLPMTLSEARRLGWKALDVIIVTGDAYVDSPHVGAALVGKALVRAGFRVGVIAQPDLRGPEDVTRLGEPEIYWGVTAGCTDSLVANYTASGRRRRSDDFSPGGRNDRRPDRAAIVYANLIRRHCPGRRPIVLGGVEASLRRVSHYDFLSGSIRRPVLFDAKADVLVYGMGEAAAVTLARRMGAGRDFRDIPGIAYAAQDMPPGFMELPSHAEAAADESAFARLFSIFHKNCGPEGGAGLCQKVDTRYLVVNPPPPAASPDEWYEAGFERAAHPLHAARGPVKAVDTIRLSIATHRGCFGGCRFCAIALHEGRAVASRSPASILAEAESLAGRKGFPGRITDIGGPTANMYGMGCKKKPGARCGRESCLYPSPCRNLDPSHAPLMALYEDILGLPRMKAVTVGSGVRHDLVMADRAHGRDYIAALAARHVSGQLKVAPEHSEKEVLSLMGKPGPESLIEFSRLFSEYSQRCGKRQFLTHYFLAAHPGCTLRHMERLSAFCRERLLVRPRQVQIFTPTPSTWSTLMFATGRDQNGEEIFVERTAKGREAQKEALTGREPR